MKNMYQKLTRHVWWRDVLSSLAFLLMLLMLDVGLRYMHDGIAMTRAGDSVPWIFTVCWVAGLTAVIRILPRLARRIVTGIVGGFYNLLFIVHAIMYYAKGNFFSFSSLIFAEDGMKFLSTEYMQVGILTWVLFAVGIIATVISVWLAPKLDRSFTRRIVLWSVTAAVVAGCILGVHINKVQNLSERLAVHFDIHQVSLVYDDFSDSNESLMLAGMYQFTLRDFAITYGLYDVFSHISAADEVAKLNKWYENKTVDPDNEMTGVFAGKNLILIQLEAIDTWLINPTFMPNLYKIQQKSINFTQNYTPLYIDAGTFNTEMTVNTGLVTPFTGSRASMYSRNTYPLSLASLMRRAGYTANSFHRSAADTYNRGEVHENWGYEKYYSGEDMGIERMDFDEELMRAYDKITEGDRFFSFIITYSGHGPYQDSAVSAAYYDMAAALLPKDTPEMKIHAYAHAWATDLFIGALMQRLEEDGYLDNTVVAFYADHYDYYTMDTQIVKDAKGVDDNNLITNTPFFIYEKNTAPRNVDKVMAAYDILPTLVNMFALDTDGRYYVGNDAFSPNGGYVIFEDYSWYDGKTYYNTRAENELTADNEARNDEVRTRLQMSWQTMRLNYFTTIK